MGTAGELVKLALAVQDINNDEEAKRKTSIDDDFVFIS